MIIGIDASRANQEQKTGVGWYAYHLIQSLKKITPEDVRVVLYTDKPLRQELADLPKNWTQKVLKWPPQRLWTQIRLSFEMLIHPPDILFIPAHVFPIIHPKRTVMTVHDIAAARFPASYNWFERWYTLWSAKFAVKNLYKVIVPSEFTKSELVSLSRTERDSAMAGQVGKFVSDKIRVVYHGYDERYDKKNLINIKQILNKYSITQPYLLSVGRLEEKKNTVIIIKSFEKLKIDSKLIIQNLKLVLVGMPGYSYKKVQQAIESSPYKSDIITPGWVEDDDLPPVMAGAEVFVFPSLYEGFGLPILEAFASGVPIVTSRGGALEEVGEDVCFYVEPEDIQEISNSVIKLLSDRKFKNSLANRGLERAKQFSWEKCARETLGLLLGA